MIVGIAALFSILFFGGSQEYFLIEDFEKGVKKYITDKERGKELIADLKLTKSMIKAFEKKRKKLRSELQDMNLSREITKEAYESFFKDRLAERVLYQEKLLERRLLITDKISEAEWQSIIELSQASLSKSVSKAEKKTSKDPFKIITATIKESVSDADKRQQALEAFNQFKLDYTNFLIEVNKVNSLESDILKNRSSTASDFNDLSQRLNELRRKSYRGLIDLHFALLELTTEQEWGKIMKAINKNLI